MHGPDRDHAGVAELFFGIGEDSATTPGIREVKGMHAVFGMLVIDYLALHVFAAIWHQKQGHDVISRIK